MSTTTTNSDGGLDVESATTEELREMMRDGSLTIECPDAQTASELTQTFYGSDHPSDVFHVEHYPVTDDEKPVPESYMLVIRRLNFDSEMGWFSTDVRPYPDVVLE